MELAAKLQNDWLVASQSYFTCQEEGKSEEEAEEYMNKQIDNCIKDLVDNGVEYLKELSRCDCCERHQTKRPGCIEDLKDYSSSGDISVETRCKCACRHYCRFIVNELNN